MDKTTEKIRESIREQKMPSSTIMFKFVTLHNRSQYDYYCVVEGKTDEIFYGNTSIEPFASRNIAFIFKDYSKGDNLVGKDAVIDAFQNLSKKFPSDMKKCIFIIDHDYDGLVSQRLRITSTEEANITVLPCYSFENYFLLKENVLRIFRLIQASPELHETFLAKFQKFLIDTYEYYALKSVFTAQFKKPDLRIKTGKYKKMHMDEDIFAYNFRNDPEYSQSKLLEEVEKMRQAVNGFESAQRYYENSYAKMVENEVRYVRGKNILRYLKEFLFQHANIDMRLDESKLYRQIVKALDVDLAVIVGGRKVRG